MKAPESYTTLFAPAGGDWRERGSKFFAYAYPADSRQAFEVILASVRREHPKARHFCYAYRMITGEEIQEHASDAGEPPGSAGKPILGELKRNGLLNVGVVVVRYFGGTKLGIRGLIQAYRESTRLALGTSQFVERVCVTNYAISMPLALQAIFYDTCKSLNLHITNHHYNDRFTAIVEIPARDPAVHLHALVTKLAGSDGTLEGLCTSLDVQINTETHV